MFVNEIQPTLHFNPLMARTNEELQAQMTRLGLTFARSGDRRFIGSDGAYATAAANVPRLEFDPTTGRVRGHSAGLQHVNQIRNNSMTGAVAGTPGTLPTSGWSTGLGGLSQQIVGIGTENGVDYIDLRFSGTATSTLARVRFETTTQITASSGQVWTSSFFFKRVAEPNPAASFASRIFENTVAGAEVTSGAQSITTSTTLTRYTQTRTLSGGVTVERVQPVLDINLVSGNTYDFTIRIGWPQMQLGPIATDPIRTTNAAGTASAEALTRASASGLISATEFAIQADVDMRAYTSSVNRRIASIRLDANNNVSLDIGTAGTSIVGTVNSGGVEQASISKTSLTTGVHRVLLSVKANEFRLFWNGTTVTSDVSGSVPDLTAAPVGIGIRADGDSSTALGDILRNVKFYNRAVTEAFGRAATRV